MDLVSLSVQQATNKRPLVTTLNLWTVIAFANNLSRQRTPYVQRSATDDLRIDAKQDTFCHVNSRVRLPATKTNTSALNIWS